jgi:anti-anti-sigma factor
VASTASSDSDDDEMATESPQQRLKLRVQSCDGYTIVNVWGELRAGTTDLLNGMLTALTRTSGTRILLDLSRLYDLDSDAISELSRWQTALASSSGGLWLAAPRPWVRRLLDQACLRGTFTIYPTMLEALAEITPSVPQAVDGA